VHGVEQILHLLEYYGIVIVKEQGFILKNLNTATNIGSQISTVISSNLKTRLELTPEVSYIISIMWPMDNIWDCSDVAD
jgi:hypothetical protein